jgi:hypothetical protein
MLYIPYEFIYRDQLYYLVAASLSTCANADDPITPVGLVRAVKNGEQYSTAVEVNGRFIQGQPILPAGSIAKSKSNGVTVDNLSGLRKAPDHNRLLAMAKIAVQEIGQ